MASAERGSLANTALAIVLHGKIGSMGSVLAPGSEGRTRAVDGARASAPMMALCYASLLQHVVQPNERRGMTVDLFGHSWSPEVAEVCRHTQHSHSPHPRTPVS